MRPRSWRQGGPLVDGVMSAGADQRTENRVLSFDVDAAARAVVLTAGKPRSTAVDIRGTEIAGIAQARQATIAPQNFQHIEGPDEPVVNPQQKFVVGVPLGVSVGFGSRFFRPQHPGWWA